jgi:hypothetical protein
LEENNYPNQHTFPKCNHEHFVKNLPFFHLNFFCPKPFALAPTHFISTSTWWCSSRNLINIDQIICSFI